MKENKDINGFALIIEKIVDYSTCDTFFISKILSTLKTLSSCL